jgi:hypothetical protein
VARLVDDEPDETIAAMVAGWPRRFAAERALALGFECEQSYDEIIQAYLEDDAGTGPSPPIASR